MKTIRIPLFAALAGVALAACSGDSTGPSAGDGEAAFEVAARGDDAPATAQQSPTGGATFTHTSAEGTIRFRARVYAQTSAGSWVELTNRTAQEAAVDASGHGSAVVFARTKAKAQAYGRVRVVFESVRADLDGQLQVGTGLLSGAVSVDLRSDGQVVVEREVSVSARAGATTRVLLNLNAGAWLNRANATTRTVAESEFASAVRVTAQ